jgi:serine protease
MAQMPSSQKRHVRTAVLHHPTRPTTGRGRTARFALLAAAALAAGLGLSSLLSSTQVTAVRVIRPREATFARTAASASASEAAPVPAPAGAGAGETQTYAPHTLVVGYSGSAAGLIDEVRNAGRGLATTTKSTKPSLTPGELILTLPRRASVTSAARAIAGLPHVNYSVPDYVAHIAADWYPDDTGRSRTYRGWEKLQWNFLPRAGVDAPAAWANLEADGRPGARGVTIAVVDTGIAFRNWQGFRRSPDFAGTRFAHPCDLVVGTIRHNHCTDPYALDRESHGTFVTGAIAEATNNRYGLTGLAYEATIIPVRVLDADGNGDASTIAAGIRYAVRHRAQVINLSIEFSPGTTGSEIPDVISAITYAHNRGVVVVGAAGNDEDTSIDYPAALPDVISVGASTDDLCLASYSDVGAGLDLVAPGGGDDAAAVPGSVCHPDRNLPDIYQMTFPNPSRPSAFGFPSGWFGTSMAAPDVSAAAAMVIASGVIGAHPSPDAILARLEATARPLGAGLPNDDYGYGLLDVGAATAPGGPDVPVSTTTTTTTTTATAPTTPTTTTGSSTTATTGTPDTTT